MKIRIAFFLILLLVGITGVFSQTDVSIPRELLRPRREEAPRYPIDTVIGTLGQGQASQEAYEFARRTAAALLRGDMAASILSSVSRAFLEDRMDMLKEINPRFFRLGSGREEPDGAVSFMIRFAGRDQGITGELFVRLQERRPTPAKPAVQEQASQPETEGETGLESEADSADQEAEVAQLAEQNEAQAVAQNVAQAPQQNVPSEKAWVFEDLILEEARSRETENAEGHHRFDFPPYERFF
jgi:hypothetical protein